MIGCHKVWHNVTASYKH
uniref:Uncharacterized protein n=1 Tax=Arundo donax TaxID=35708 RepID=A0A0A8YXL4_ARUDO